jgi:hypothetical protein
VGDGCTRIADKHVLEDWNRQHPVTSSIDSLYFRGTIVDIDTALPACPSDLGIQVSQSAFCSWTL